MLEQKSNRGNEMTVWCTGLLLFNWVNSAARDQFHKEQDGRPGQQRWISTTWRKMAMIPMYAIDRSNYHLRSPRVLYSLWHKDKADNEPSFPVVESVCENCALAWCLTAFTISRVTQNSAMHPNPCNYEDRVTSVSGLIIPPSDKAAQYVSVLLRDFLIVVRMGAPR